MQKGLGNGQFWFRGFKFHALICRGTTPQHSLFTVFSHFGLLYSVRVFPNAAVARPGFYAIIKFYSARDARRAQKACHEKHLFQNSPVKVGPNRKFLTPLGRSAEFHYDSLAFMQPSDLQKAFRCVATAILRFSWVFVCFLFLDEETRTQDS